MTERLKRYSGGVYGFKAFNYTVNTYSVFQEIRCFTQNNIWDK